MIIHPILAEGASNAQLGLWVACASIVLNILVAGIFLVKAFRNDAEKREVAITPDIVRRPDFDRHVDGNVIEINSLHTKVGSSERATREIVAKEIAQLRTERARDMENLNDEILQLSHTVGKVSAQNEMQNQRLVQMDAKLDRLVERRNNG